MTAPTLPSDYPLECPVCHNSDPARIAPWNMSASGLAENKCLLCRECGATFTLPDGWVEQEHNDAK